MALCACLVPIIWGIASCAPENAIENSEISSEYRIAALSPSVGLLLQQLGLEEHIVGRHGFDTFLDESIPVVGDQAGIDYERLAGVRPTHVLMEWGSRDLPERLTRLSSRHGWVVRDFQLLELDDLWTSLEMFAVLFDAQQQAALLHDELIEALEPLESVPEGVSVLPMYWTSPLGAAGPDSFHAQMLTRLGLRLALDSGPSYIEMESEDLARLDPTIIVLFAPRVDEGFIEDSRSTLGSLGLEAISTDRFIVVDDHTCLSLSAQIAQICADIKRRVSTMSFD
ncbi:MAG: ABC transporter substrate-binding protein [Phycisphaerales bacterium JB043]